MARGTSDRVFPNRKGDITYASFSDYGTSLIMRSHGPAVVCASGKVSFYTDKGLHREAGPAVYTPYSGGVEYSIKGVKVNGDYFVENIAPRLI